MSYKESMRAINLRARGSLPESLRRSSRNPNPLDLSLRMAVTILKLRSHRHEDQAREKFSY